MLLLAWMARAAMLAVLVSVAAWALEEVLRSWGRPTRFIWVGALLLTIALPSITLIAPDLWPESLMRSGGVIMLPVSQPGLETAVTETTVAPHREYARDILICLWFSASLLLMLRWLHGWHKLRALHSRFRAATLAGEHVVIADRFGPAVVGLVRPRVVIPAWLLNSDAEQQRMIVRHEAEHIRAGDHWLLALAPILLALFPWNPALWWQRQRLRIAVELDCDARVLRAGVSAHAYGSMLLDVASGAAVVQPTLAAFSEPRSSLERRIRAMTPSRYRHTLARAASFTALSALTLAGALIAGAPTAPPVVAQQAPPLPPVPPVVTKEQQPPVPVAVKEQKRPAPPTVVQPPRPVPPIAEQQEGRPLLVLNGKPLEPTAKLDASLNIKAIDVLGTTDAVQRFGTPGRFGAVLVTTHTPDELNAITILQKAATDVRVRSETGAKSPLVVLDGVIVDSDVLQRLDRNTIDRVEVVKGAAAVARYGERGADGVILITTKNR